MAPVFRRRRHLDDTPGLELDVDHGRIGELPVGSRDLARKLRRHHRIPDEHAQPHGEGPHPSEHGRELHVRPLRSGRVVRRGADVQHVDEPLHGDLSSDDLERVESDLEKLTRDMVAAVDKLLAHKEQELLEI